MEEQTTTMTNALRDVGVESFKHDATGRMVEAWIQNAVEWLRLGIETMGAIIIGIGVLVALLALLRTLIARKRANFNAIRLGFARYLAMALEFQLGADILSTAIAPTWGAIGRLAAIAIIRTALNFFLMREIKEESQQMNDHDNPSQHIAF